MQQSSQRLTSRFKARVLEAQIHLIEAEFVFIVVPIPTRRRVCWLGGLVAAESGVTGISDSLRDKGYLVTESSYHFCLPSSVCHLLDCSGSRGPRDLEVTKNKSFHKLAIFSLFLSSSLASGLLRKPANAHKQEKALSCMNKHARF